MDFEFLGPYKIEKVLGQGGMGSVYKGVHAKTGEPVAVKVIASVLADQQRFRRRFKSEYETLKQLKHPNIVRLIGYGEEQGHLFYSMEYVDGESLQELIKRLKILPWLRVIEICIDVCSALKQAHDSGVIHRDLKPANIMISKTGEVKLTDFGIAKLFGNNELTAVGSVVGTADFMPPEQAEGKGVTSRSDLYAVGSLAYAALAGRAPFVGRSVPEVLYAVRYNAPTPLVNLSPDTPSELIELVEELLQKDPNKRPPTALVVANRLKALKVGLLRREEQQTASKTAIENAALQSEMTSIDIDALKEDPQLKSLHSGLEQTIVTAPTRSPNTSPTKSPISNAGPEDVTRVATPSALESDFISMESGDRVVGETRFTIADEKERVYSGGHLSGHNESHPWAQWMSIAGLVIMLVVCGVSLYIFTRPPSADRMIEQIDELVGAGDESQLLEAEAILDHLKTIHPKDPRIETYEALHRDVELIRLYRYLKRTARNDGGAGNMDPMEQAFLDCLLARDQNRDIAIQKVNAFLAVFGKSGGLGKKQEQMIEQAKFLAEEFKKGGGNAKSEAAENLIAQMQWAVTSLQGEDRKSFYRGVIELYKEKIWAKEIVEQAKKGLSVLENP